MKKILFVMMCGMLLVGTNYLAKSVFPAMMNNYAESKFMSDEQDLMQEAMGDEFEILSIEREDSGEARFIAKHNESGMVFVYTDDGMGNANVECYSEMETE